MNEGFEVLCEKKLAVCLLAWTGTVKENVSLPFDS
jgi:hypothetical protein